MTVIEGTEVVPVPTIIDYQLAVSALTQASLEEVARNIGEQDAVDGEYERRKEVLQVLMNAAPTPGKKMSLFRSYRGAFTLRRMHLEEADNNKAKLLATNKARFAMHDLIWSLRDELHGEIFWEDAQLIGNKIFEAVGER